MVLKGGVVDGRIVKEGDAAGSVEEGGADVAEHRTCAHESGQVLCRKPRIRLAQHFGKVLRLARWVLKGAGIWETVSTG
jgi:hypothetical protein